MACVSSTSGALTATISSTGTLVFSRTDTGRELLREHYPLHGKPGREYSAFARGTGSQLMRVAQVKSKAILPLLAIYGHIWTDC